MWMEVGTIVIILGPILFPAAVALGIHPVHFGIILILGSVMGVATPPVGVCLYAASSIAGIPAEKTMHKLWPFLTAQLCMIMLMIFIDELVMYLPRVFELVR
jgi:TRAP-type C4-dicarboxylate transport system permease large subunit